MLVGMALAVWPVWRWYALRTIDGSDEPCGVLALATLAAICRRDRSQQRLEPTQFIAPALLLVVYALTFHTLTPLPRAMIAAAAFGSLFRGRTVVAQCGLLALSLPVIATVQFYLGFPLRVVAAEGSGIMLRALDFAVTRDGSSLFWRGETIMVDAPCSGVRMLWFGLYLAAVLACWSRLSNLRSALLFAAAFVLVIGANVIRATALFFKETGVVALPEWTHSGIGVGIFGLAALVILRLAATRENQPCCA
jgi:exosortase/archaeosortase family protein